MKHLILLILLFPSLVLAIDDATVQAIDSKASSANVKADGNNSRIQALEAEDVLIHQRIDNLPSGPAGPQGPIGPAGPQGASGQLGLADKSCPANLAVVGFDSNGYLICAAPWNIPNGGDPDPIDLTLSCIENHNQAVVESEIVNAINALQDYLQLTLQSQPLVGSTDLLDYQISFDSILFNGSPNVSAPLVEITEAEPCADAVNVVSNLPDIVINGYIHGSLLGGGIPIAGNYQINIIGVTVEGLARLSSPDLSGVSSSGSFDRVVDSFVLTSYSTTNVDFQSDNTLVEVLANIIESSVSDNLALSFEQLLGPVIVGIPPPVTVEVTVTP